MMEKENRQEHVSGEVNGNETSSESMEKRSSNSKSAFRTLAAFYLAYLVYQMIDQIAGGYVPRKTMPWIIAAIIAFCIGAVWLIWPEVKRMKEVLDHVEP